MKVLSKTSALAVKFELESRAVCCCQQRERERGFACRTGFSLERERECVRLRVSLGSCGEGHHLVSLQLHASPAAAGGRLRGIFRRPEQPSWPIQSPIL